MIAEYWNNLFFPLQALKAQVGFNEDLSYLHPKIVDQIMLKFCTTCFRHYKVHRGREDQGIYFEKVLHSLSKAENRTVVNPRFNGNSLHEQPHLKDKMVAQSSFWTKWNWINA